MPLWHWLWSFWLPCIYTAPINCWNAGKSNQTRISNSLNVSKVFWEKIMAHRSRRGSTSRRHRIAIVTENRKFLCFGGSQDCFISFWCLFNLSYLCSRQFSRMHSQCLWLSTVQDYIDVDDDLSWDTVELDPWHTETDSNKRHCFVAYCFQIGK